MNRLFVLGGAVVLAGLIGASVHGEGKEAKPASVKVVMKAAMVGPKSFKAKFETANKAKEKDYEAMTKLAKDWLACTENLAKNEPPKGEKESWAKQCGGVTKCLTTLVGACEKKDDKQINGCVGFLTKSCGGCHSQHKPK